MRFNALIPEMSVRDIERSKWLNGALLGFQIEYERTIDRFIFLSLGEVQMMPEEVNGH